MILLLVLGAAMVLSAIALVSFAFGDGEPRGLNRSLAVLQAMTTAPKELTKDLEKPFSESTVRAVIERFVK